jgi:sugar O-acyltransferase (sialic acid O-acetyltransferase NeuD family)
MKEKKLIILGDSSFAEIAYEYFTHDSPYEVVAFSVEKKFLHKKELFGLPIVPFEELAEYYNPTAHSIFAAIVYTQLNRLRTRLYQKAKSQGFAVASYISSRAFIWKNCQIGEHCFIFEDNVIQPFVAIGDNVILWSGNHIGHHSIIKNNCFIASHVVISGHCEIGENCFFGVNSTVGNQVIIGKDCLIGAGALILKNCEATQTYKGIITNAAPVSSLKIFKVEEV